MESIQKAHVSASQVKDLLFADEQSFVYAVLDGAAIKGLSEKLKGADYFEPIMLGRLEPELYEVAPFLASLTEDSPFTNWLLGEACQEFPNMGFLLRSSADMSTTNQHCRSLLNVEGPSGDVLYFRWYDPRVFSAFVDSCDDPTQSAQFLGPITMVLIPKLTEFSVYQSNGSDLELQTYKRS